MTGRLSILGTLLVLLASCGSSAAAVPEAESVAAPAPIATPGQGPAPAQGSVGQSPATSTGLNDAPHLFVAGDRSVTARWVADGKLQTRTFAAGAPIVLPEFAHLLGDSLVLKKPEPPKCQWDMPPKLLALSDVEGEYGALLKFLTNNGVVDKEGHWSFGSGHLVGVGDMVDRGDQVTETLWLFYRLSLEAEAAGGHVHFVNGNHEAMMMGGDVRYTHSKYFAVAELMGLPCQGLVGADTVIGQWLRTRNCVERIGDYAFVHAGLSPFTVGKKLDYDLINRTVRSFLGVPPERFSDPRVFELCWGRSGPLWYRGFFAEHALAFGPTPTVGQFEQLLALSGVKHIVVGHTQVPAVRTRFEGGLIPIDVPWTDPANVRALVLRGGKASVVDIEGTASPLE